MEPRTWTAWSVCAADGLRECAFLLAHFPLAYEIFRCGVKYSRVPSWGTCDRQRDDNLSVKHWFSHSAQTLFSQDLDQVNMAMKSKIVSQQEVWRWGSRSFLEACGGSQSSSDQTCLKRKFEHHIHHIKKELHSIFIWIRLKDWNFPRNIDSSRKSKWIHFFRPTLVPSAISGKPWDCGICGHQRVNLSPYSRHLTKDHE